MKTSRRNWTTTSFRFDDERHARFDLLDSDFCHTIFDPLLSVGTLRQRRVEFP
jgi:hypothetical protein